MIYQPKNATPSNSAVVYDARMDGEIRLRAIAQTNAHIIKSCFYITDMNDNIATVKSPEAFNVSIYNNDYMGADIYASYEQKLDLRTNRTYKWKARLVEDIVDIPLCSGTIISISEAEVIVSGPDINLQKSLDMDYFLPVTRRFFTSGLPSSLIISSISINSDGNLILVFEKIFPNTVKVGDSYTIYTNYLDTEPGYIFYPRSPISLSINNVPTTLDNKSYTFQGIYSQAENISINYYQFSIYLKNADGTKTLINQSDKIYSAKLSYTYDGFRSGNTYYVKMQVENSLGMTASTQDYSFDVEYSLVAYSQQPQAYFNSKLNANVVSWSSPVEHDGYAWSFTNMKTNSSYLYNVPFSGVNSLYTKNYYGIWDSYQGLCTLPDDFNLTFQFSPDKSFFYDNNGMYMESATLFTGETDDAEDSGDFTISIDKNKLIFTQNPDINLEAPFYSGITQVFVLSNVNTIQLNNDYIWNDDETWNDTYYWVEGGTSLERICDHWWKVQIDKTGIKIEEVYPDI